MACPRDAATPHQSRCRVICPYIIIIVAIIVNAYSDRFCLLPNASGISRRSLGGVSSHESCNIFYFFVFHRFSSVPHNFAGENRFPKTPAKNPMTKCHRSTTRVWLLQQVRGISCGLHNVLISAIGTKNNFILFLYYDARLKRTWRNTYKKIVVICIITSSSWHWSVRRSLILSFSLYIYLCIIVVYSQVFVRHTSIDFKVKLVSGSLRTDATIILLYTVDRRLTATEPIMYIYIHYIEIDGQRFICIYTVFIYMYKKQINKYIMYGRGAGKQKKSAGYNSDIQNVFYTSCVLRLWLCIRFVGLRRRRSYFSSVAAPLKPPSFYATSPARQWLFRWWG